MNELINYKRINTLNLTVRARESRIDGVEFR
jgi:hypothetical protein